MDKRSSIPETRSSLTAERVKTTPAPPAGSITLWDADLTGFGVRIFAPTERHPNGARSFFLNYRVDGRERRFSIGLFPTWTVVAAREEAKALRRLVNQGADPASDKRERREAPTLRDLIDRYIEDHLPRIAAREHKDQRRMLEIIATYLGPDRKVADVHFGDMQAMHRKITESGRPVRANRVLGVASKMFSLALLPRAGESKPWRTALHGNPCKGVERNREEARERFFSPAELAAITVALAEYPAQGPADCIRLIMLTGCRPQEALRARWDHFDAEPGFWVKPSTHTKQRKVHKAPLAPAALELIDRRRKQRDKSEWVFPGAVPGEPLAALWHVWHFVRNRAGLGRDAHVYSLRHTFASVGAGGGLSLQIIGRLMGHTQARTTQRYAHLADDPLREAANKIGNVIASAGKGRRNIVSLKQ